MSPNLFPSSGMAGVGSAMTNLSEQMAKIDAQRKTLNAAAKQTEAQLKQEDAVEQFKAQQALKTQYNNAVLQLMLAGEPYESVAIIEQMYPHVAGIVPRILPSEYESQKNLLQSIMGQQTLPTGLTETPPYRLEQGEMPNKELWETGYQKKKQTALELANAKKSNATKWSDFVAQQKYYRDLEALKSGKVYSAKEFELLTPELQAFYSPDESGLLKRNPEAVEFAENEMPQVADILNQMSKELRGGKLYKTGVSAPTEQTPEVKKEKEQKLLRKYYEAENKQMPANMSEEAVRTELQKRRRTQDEQTKIVTQPKTGEVFEGTGQYKGRFFRKNAKGKAEEVFK